MRTRAAVPHSSPRILDDRSSACHEGSRLRIVTRNTRSGEAATHLQDGRPRPVGRPGDSLSSSSRPLNLPHRSGANHDWVTLGLFCNTGEGVLGAPAGSCCSGSEVRPPEFCGSRSEVRPPEFCCAGSEVVPPPRDSAAPGRGSSCCPGPAAPVRDSSYCPGPAAPGWWSCRRPGSAAPGRGSTGWPGSAAPVRARAQEQEARAREQGAGLRSSAGRGVAAREPAEERARAEARLGSSRRGFPRRC